MLGAKTHTSLDSYAAVAVEAARVYYLLLSCFASVIITTECADRVQCLLQQADITYDAQTFLSNWFNQHAAVANSLGKPLLLEEFGKAVNVRSLVHIDVLGPYSLLCVIIPPGSAPWLEHWLLCQLCCHPKLPTCSFYSASCLGLTAVSHSTHCSEL